MVGFFGQALFRRGFNSSKCKTLVRLAMSRIKLLRNKREMQLKQMRRDVAMLLQSGQEASARIRVEHVIREQNIMAANEIIELFCELVVVRLPIIGSRRECPVDLKEGISSLIFSAPRCADIPELLQIRDLFEKKYGKEFVAAATELRPDCCVNRTLVEKLSVRTPTGEIKLKLMKEIAKDHQLEWDTSESERELLRSHENLLEGPSTFVSATSMPARPTSSGDTTTGPPNRQHFYREREVKSTHFENMSEAAEAAAEAADKAVAAARAVAYLANKHPHQVDQQRGAREGTKSFGIIDNQTKLSGRICQSQNFDRWNYPSDDDKEHLTTTSEFETAKMSRRHSYNMPATTLFSDAQHSEIKFGDSDGWNSGEESGEEMEMDMPPSSGHGQCAPLSFPPSRPPPPLPPTAHESISSSKQKVSCVHPKLPDYDELAARFDALKNQRS